MNDDGNRGLSPVLMMETVVCPRFCVPGFARLTRISRPVATRFAAVFPSGSGELAGGRRQGGEGGFGAVSKRTDALNPFDLFNRPGALLDADAVMLASLLAVDVGFHKEPFWDNWGRSLMAGVIPAVAETSPKAERHFGKVPRNSDERRRGL